MCAGLVFICLYSWVAAHGEQLRGTGQGPCHDPSLRAPQAGHWACKCWYQQPPLIYETACNIASVTLKRAARKRVAVPNPGMWSCWSCNQ